MLFGQLFEYVDSCPNLFFIFKKVPFVIEKSDKAIMSGASV